MSNQRILAVAAVLGPALLLAAMLWHPFLPDISDKGHVAEEMAADPDRWFGSHLLTAIGSAGIIVAFLAARSHIRSSVGHEPWTARALTPIVVGSVLFAMLPAMEIALLGAQDAGADVQRAQEEMDTWFLPLLIIGSAIFAVGSILFAIGVRKANVLSAPATWTVVAALVVAAVSRLVPVFAVLIAGSAALLIAFAVLAVTIWQAAGSPARGAPTG